MTWSATCADGDPRPDILAGVNARALYRHARWIAIALALAFAALRDIGTLGPNHLRWVLPLAS